MDTNELLTWLRYPAYGLYHVDSLEESATGNYLYDIVPTFLSRFTTSGQQAILTALEWASETPDLDFDAILPELPHSDDFKRKHLAITYKRLLQVQRTNSMNKGK